MGQHLNRRINKYQTVDMNKPINKTTSLLATALMIAAILALINILISPSSQHKAWLLGFSAQRLALGLIPFIYLFLYFLITVLAGSAPQQTAQKVASFNQFSSRSAMLLGSLCFWGSTAPGWNGALLSDCHRPICSKPDWKNGISVSQFVQLPGTLMAYDHVHGCLHGRLGNLCAPNS